MIVKDKRRGSAAIAAHKRAAARVKAQQGQEQRQQVTGVAARAHERIVTLLERPGRVDEDYGADRLGKRSGYAAHLGREELKIRERLGRFYNRPH